MELSEFRALVAVVENGSFTKAAEALGQHKAALSRTISLWEARLGARLLERSTRALSLTEIGREVYERARIILNAVKDAEDLVLKTRAAPRGLLRLSCGVEFGMLAVSRWIDHYLLRHPEVQIEADFSGRLIDLVHEGFDLAIRLGELPDSSLVARRLGELHYGLFASADYLTQRGTPNIAPDLQHHSLLAFSASRGLRAWRLRRADEQITIKGSIRLKVNNSFAVRDAAVLGLGIAQLPRWLAQPEVSEGRLKAVLPDWTLAPVPVHALFPSGKYLSPKVRAFIELASNDFVSGGQSVTPGAPPGSIIPVSRSPATVFGRPD